MKLKEWLDIWLNKYTKFAVKLRTYERYRYIIEKHINHKLGEFDLDDLSAVTLQDYVLSDKINETAKKIRKILFVDK